MFALFKTKVEKNESHLKNLILMARSESDINKPELEVIFQIGLERGFSESKIKELLSTEKKFSLHIPENDADRFDQLYDQTLPNE